MLFSCKGIQQKLLKRSCPQNGAAHLPFLGVSHLLLLLPRGREAGGTVYQSLQPWKPPWGHWRREGRLGGVSSMAISKVPLEWGLGHGMASPRRTKNLHPFLPSFLSQSQIFQTEAAKDSRSPELALRELGGVGGRMTGESPDKVSGTGRGRQHHQLSRWGCILVGRAPSYL